MKCSRCGKEFGAGTNCQHCGIDRVTGLANYSGYDGSAGRNGDDPSFNGGYAAKTTVCFSCGEIIPADSKFCPHCSISLYVTCPKCGHKYSSQFPACNKCGTNRSQYLKEKREREFQEKIEEQNRAFQEHIMLTKKGIYLKEAQELRDSYGSPMLKIVLSILFVGVLLFLFFYYYDKLPLVLWLVILIAMGLCCPLFAIVIVDSITNSKIKKWKRENPNDPRSEYL